MPWIINTYKSFLYNNCKIIPKKRQKCRADNVKHKPKGCMKKVELSMRNYKIIRVVQATHHHGDVRCSISRCIQCSCMSHTSVSHNYFASHNYFQFFLAGDIIIEFHSIFFNFSKKSQK